MIIKDDIGYIFEILLHDLQKGVIPHKFSTHNKYTIYNINVYINDKNIKSRLLSKTYENNKVPLLFMCSCGNKFHKTIRAFFDRPYCRECGKMNYWNIHKVKEYLNNNYPDIELYDNNYINNNSYMNFKCHCGNDFKTTWKRFLLGKNKCSKCTNHKSSLEIKVEDWLIENNISFISEYSIELYISNIMFLIKKKNIKKSLKKN